MSIATRKAALMALAMHTMRRAKSITDRLAERDEGARI